MTPTSSFNKLPKQYAKTRVKELFHEDRYFSEVISDFLHKEVIIWFVFPMCYLY